jgi:hypothetical protein
VFEGGIFVGKGYLVLAYGSGVVEQILSVLNNPPHGEAALRESEVYERAESLLALQPGMLFQLADGSRYSQMLVQELNDAIDQFEQMEGLAITAEDGGEGEEERVNGGIPYDLLRRLVPEEADVDQMLGVIVTQMIVGDDGVMIQRVTELPPE